MGDQREQQPFLASPSNSSSDVRDDKYGVKDSLRREELPNRYPRQWPLTTQIIWSFLVLLNLGFIANLVLSKPNPCIRPRLSYSPALDIIEYQRKELKRDIDNNPFTGNPRPEFDEAWHNLLEPMVIRISNQELKAIGQPSLALVDGSGFIGEISTYHELHCIKRVRRHLNLEHYYPNLTGEALDIEYKHIDHCLEYWREAAMCRGDTTLSPFMWIKDKPFSPQFSTHECINWDKLVVWAEARKIDSSNYSLFTRDVVWPS